MMFLIHKLLHVNFCLGINNKEKIEWMKKFLDTPRETSSLFSKQIFEDADYLPFIKRTQTLTENENEEKDISKSKVSVKSNHGLEKMISFFEGLANIFKKENIVEDFEKYVNIRKDSLYNLYNTNPGDVKRSKFLSSLTETPKEEHKRRAIEFNHYLSGRNKMVTEKTDRIADDDLIRHHLEINCTTDTNSQENTEDDFIFPSKSVLKQKGDHIKRKHKIDSKKRELQKQIVKLDDNAGPLQLNAVPITRHKKAVTTIIQDCDFTGDTNNNGSKSPELRSGDFINNAQYKSKRSTSTVAMNHKSMPKLLTKLPSTLDPSSLNEEVRGRKFEGVDPKITAGLKNLHLPEIASTKSKESPIVVMNKTPRKSEAPSQDNRQANKTPRLKNISSCSNITVIQNLPGSNLASESVTPIIDHLDEVSSDENDQQHQLQGVSPSQFKMSMPAASFSMFQNNNSTGNLKKSPVLKLGKAGLAHGGFKSVSVVLQSEKKLNDARGKQLLLQ